MTTTDVLLIGCGAMGGALLKGWLMNPDLQGPFYVATPRRESVTPFLSDTRVRFVEDPANFTTPPRIIVCAVKPSMVATVLPAYMRLMNEGTLLVSVAAGLPLAFYARFLLPQAAAVRVMPNLASSVGAGISLMCASRPLSGEENSVLHHLLAATGRVIPLESDDALEALTPLTGCGPAFLFRFMEALTRATQALGVDAEIAADLTRALITGCGTFLEKSPLPVETLRQQVTSPQGMTWAGLEVFNEDACLDKLLTSVLQASFMRAKEMKDAYGS
ncbi:MAG: NAD(P)-binding domain-containing protein [Proteobacteria bacterium]|nr:NAD(P)-binding domain-containing protein [Pseudomonadota bacterium]